MPRAFFLGNLFVLRYFFFLCLVPGDDVLVVLRGWGTIVDQKSKCWAQSCGIACGDAVIFGKRVKSS